MAEEGEAPHPEPSVLASLRHRILHGSSWVLAGRIASIVLGVAINALLARMLTHDDFGVYMTSFTLVIVGAVVAQLGLDRAVVVLVSSSLGVGKPGRARQAIRQIVIIGVIGSVGVGIAMTVGLGPWIKEHFYQGSVAAIVLPLTGGWLIASAIQSIFVETLRGLQRFAQATIFDAVLVDVLLASVFGAMWVAGVRHMGPGGAIGIWLATTAVVAVVASVLAYRHWQGIQGEGVLERGAIFQIAWPSLITNVAIYFLGSGVDLLVLAAFRGHTDVALYGAATRLVTLVATPLWILRGVMPPLIAELHAQGRRRELETALRAGATLAGLPSLVLLLLFVVFGRGLMTHLYGSAFFAQGATVLAVLSLGRLVSVLAGASGITLIMTGQQRQMMYITIVTGAASVGLGILVAPRFGGVGVATATTTMAIVQNGLQLFLVKKNVGVWTHAELSPVALYRFFSKKGVATLAQQLAEADRHRKDSGEAAPGGDQALPTSLDDPDL